MTTHPRLQVYDGQNLVGEIEDRGRGKVTAFRLRPKRRIKIGVFDDRTAAMRAIAAAAREGVQVDQHS
jgi:hypothetical protein